MHIFPIFLLGVWKSRYLQMNNCDLLCYSVLWGNALLKALSMTGLNGIILHHTRLNKLEKWNQYYINLSGDSLSISPFLSPNVVLKYKWIYSVSCRWTQKIFIEMRPRRSEHKKTLLAVDTDFLFPNGFHALVEFILSSCYKRIKTQEMAIYL